MDEFLSQGLAYLHDCRVLKITYDVTDPKDRRLILLFRAPADLGYPAWDGKTLRFTACDVYLLQYFAAGNATARETLDRWNVGISESAQRELDRILAGFTVPLMKFSLVFHSGSFLELVCKGLTVEPVIDA